MLYNNDCTGKLLGLEDAIVKSVERMEACYKLKPNLQIRSEFRSTGN